MSQKKFACIYVFITLVSILHFLFAILFNNSCPQDMEWIVFQELTIRRWYVAVVWMSTVILFRVINGIRQSHLSKPKRFLLIRGISVFTVILDFVIWTLLVIGVTM